MTWEVGVGEIIWFRYTVHIFTFSQTKICWNKQNTLHPEIRITHTGVLTMQKSINMLLRFSEYLKWLKLPPSPWHLTEITTDVNGVESKNGRVNPINFCGWASKIFHDLKFHGKPFLHLPENLLLNRYFLSWLSKIFFDKCLTLKNCQSN